MNNGTTNPLPILSADDSMLIVDDLHLEPTRYVWFAANHDLVRASHRSSVGDGLFDGPVMYHLPAFRVCDIVEGVGWIDFEHASYGESWVVLDTFSGDAHPAVYRRRPEADKDFERRLKGWVRGEYGPFPQAGVRSDAA